MKKPLVLDCTLRDGGYYNSWDFREDLVTSYFNAMDESGVDVVELGFRLPPAREFLGPWAFTTDAYLTGVDLPRRAELGVMCNGSDLVEDPVGTVDELFAPADASPIGLVRIAAHFREVDSLRPALERLRELGYRVGFNLMQASVKPLDEVRSTVAQLAGWDLAEALYFADSLGNMGRSDVTSLVDVFLDEWSGDVGIHTHDNRGRALDNTLTAIERGVRWVDATVLGMGRGAGNCRTDFLLFELQALGFDGFSPEALLELTEVDFRALQARHGWGTNLLYFKSAVDNIHPTYVQAMQSDSRYGWPEMVNALDRLPELGGLSFRSQNLDVAAAGHASDGPGSFDATDWLEGREVLVVGSGPSVEQHRRAIEQYIRATKPFVVCLNTTSPIDEALIDVYAACHPTRVLFEGTAISKLSKPLLAPRRLFAVTGVPEPDQLLDFGIEVDPERIEFESALATVPTRLTLGYVLAASTVAGATRIQLVGIDGYAAGDPRQDEVVDLLSRYESMNRARPLVALTPTTYPIPQSSVYAPNP